MGKEWTQAASPINVTLWKWTEIGEKFIIWFWWSILMSTWTLKGFFFFFFLLLYVHIHFYKIKICDDKAFTTRLKRWNFINSKLKNTIRLRKFWVVMWNVGMIKCSSKENIFWHVKFSSYVIAKNEVNNVGEICLRSIFFSPSVKLFSWWRQLKLK